jgi:hypothetical protein
LRFIVSKVCNWKEEIRSILITVTYVPHETTETNCFVVLDAAHKDRKKNIP